MIRIKIRSTMAIITITIITITIIIIAVVIMLIFTTCEMATRRVRAMKRPIEADASHSITVPVCGGGGG